jgi:hypothetical protein
MWKWGRWVRFCSTFRVCKICITFHRVWCWLFGIKTTTVKRPRIRIKKRLHI